MTKLWIGIPVYNGEKHLPACLDSILVQTYPDFRIVISDNASTDGTGAIGERYAALDNRILYHCRERNFGGANNFDHVFHLSEGAYFKWAAHDDMLRPTYLEACVAALDEHPEAVGAHSLTEIIDDQGKPLTYDTLHRVFVDSAGRVHRLKLDDPTHNEDDDPLVRFRGILEGYKLNTAVFGVYRRKVMEKTGLHLPFWGQDKVLVAEFSLCGHLRVVHEPLFLRRVHPEQASSLSLKDKASWLSPGKSHYPLKTQLAALKAYAQAIARAPLSRRQKWQCLLLTLGQAVRKERWTLSYLGVRR